MGSGRQLIQARETLILELSFALGLPAHVIDAWPERELTRYQRYMAARRLPHQRQEIYLAQIALYVAASVGVSDKSLSDFLICEPPHAESDSDSDWEQQADDGGLFEGFSPQ